MKKLILISCLSFVSWTILAQAIQLDPVFVEGYFSDVDLSDEFLYLHDIETTVTNTTNDTLFIKWTRENPENCPAEWWTVLNDNLNHYVHPVISNIDDEFGIDAPMPLLPNESFNFFSIDVQPKGVPGCCTYKVHFSLMVLCFVQVLLQ